MTYYLLYLFIYIIFTKNFLKFIYEKNGMLQAGLIKDRRMINKSKGALSAKSPLICTYKRRREKKEKTPKNSKSIQFLIEDKC